MFKRDFYSRRDFITAATAATLLPLQNLFAASRPNILWLSLEDICPDLGCYGDPIAQTPNIDRFSRQAVRYTQCFSVSGVCAPSRACLATGMYSTSIGTQHMRTRTKDFPYLPKPYEAVTPPEVKHFAEYLRQAGYYCTNNAKTDYQFGEPVSVWDECSKKAHWRNRDREQPFFAVFNHEITHESQIRMPLEKKVNTDPNKIVLPPYYPDTPVVRNDFARYYDNIAEADGQIAIKLQELEEAGLAGNTIVFIFGDNGRGLPRGKRWLYDSGMQVPLLIRMPGDPQAGTVSDRLVSFVDFGPTVLSLAGVKIPKHMQGQAFSGDQRKSPRRYVYGGRDRMDETYDYIRAVRDHQFKYLRNYQPEKTYAQNITYMDEMPSMKEWRRLNAEGKLQGPQKIFFSPTKPVQELYDLGKDPHEINNLAADPAYQATLKRMAKELDRWRKQTHDLGDVPELEMVNKMWPGSQQPETATPVIRLKSKTIKLSCTTRAASIVFTTDAAEKPHWLLYSKPLSLSSSGVLRAKAIRYGYKESKEIQFEFKIKD